GILTGRPPSHFRGHSAKFCDDFISPAGRQIGHSRCPVIIWYRCAVRQRRRFVAEPSVAIRAKKRPERSHLPPLVECDGTGEIVDRLPIASRIAQQGSAPEVKPKLARIDFYRLV